MGGAVRQGLGKDREAEKLFLEARAGFAEAEDLLRVAFVGLDLALLYSRRNAWDEVQEAASESVLMLDSMNLGEDSLTAVSLLSDAVEKRAISKRLLRDVQRQLEQDPLVEIAGPGRSPAHG